MSQSPSAQSFPPLVLTLIRVGMLSGVLIFGLVAWFIQRSRGPLSGGSGHPLEYVWYGLAMMAVVGMGVIRRAQARQPSAEARTRLSIAGWALAEAPALLGCVCFILTGNALLYALGVALLVTAFGVLGVERPEEGL